MNKTMFVYINPFASYYAHKGNIKKFLDHKLETKNWTCYGDIDLPERLKNEYGMMTNEFFHGISAQQYNMVKHGGIFINPLLYGLTQNISLWYDVLHEHDESFSQNIVYIDIPWELYKSEATNDIFAADMEEYNSNTETTQKLVSDIKKRYYPSTTVVH